MYHGLQNGGMNKGNKTLQASSDSAIAHAGAQIATGKIVKVFGVLVALGQKHVDSSNSGLKHGHSQRCNTAT